VRTKSQNIADTVSRQQIDVMAITETWHRTSEDLPLKHCAPRGYSVLGAPRPVTMDCTRGGGIAVLFRDCFNGKRLAAFDAVQPTTFEVFGCELDLRSTSSSRWYVVVYRPPKSGRDYFAKFFKELRRLLEAVLAYRRDTVICGDFNLHVNDEGNKHAQSFLDVLASFGLVQVVKRRTHREGNTLDLVITRRDDQPTNCVVQAPDTISDHSLVTCRFPLKSSSAEGRALLEE